MATSPSALTVTLHWQGDAGARSANVICEDGLPAVLIPILAAGCGLPERDPQGAPIGYTLRGGQAGGRPLSAGAPLSAQGVRDGGHLWLASPLAARATPRRCALAFPEGGAVLVAPAGLGLTRRWLLRALELLHPESYARELRLLDAGRSDYRFVSNRPHCTLASAAPGAWQITTDRDDVAVRHNGAILPAGRPAGLGDGDELQLGLGGPVLTIALL